MWWCLVCGVKTRAEQTLKKQKKIKKINNNYWFGYVLGIFWVTLIRSNYKFSPILNCCLCFEPVQVNYWYRPSAIRWSALERLKTLTSWTKLCQCSTPGCSQSFVSALFLCVSQFVCVSITNLLSRFLLHFTPSLKYCMAFWVLSNISW